MINISKPSENHQQTFIKAPLYKKYSVSFFTNLSATGLWNDSTPDQLQILVQHLSERQIKGQFHSLSVTENRLLDTNPSDGREASAGGDDVKLRFYSEIRSVNEYL